MTASSCKRAFLLLAVAVSLLMGCASAGDRKPALSPVQWARTGQQESRGEISWAGGSGGGQWAGLRVAVLPVHNMTAVPAPLKDIEKLFYEELRKNGVPVLEREALEGFMTKRRVRYTGGVDSVIASAMKEEMGVEAVFVTSLEHFDEGEPPKISLHARLVSAGKDLEIRWMDGYCKAGDDSPGFLDLGVIGDFQSLAVTAVDSLVRSMILGLTGKGTGKSGKTPGWGSLPADPSRSGLPGDAGPVTIAVMPFLNLSERAYAGEIVPLHFTRRMAGMPGLRILEPGEVRRALLNSRVFLQGGLSLPHLELVLRSTGADLVLTGTVMRYLDTRAASKDPEVEFSAEMFDRESKQVVWSSRGDGRGGDGVFFFGVGRKSTACSLADALVSEAVSGRSFQPGGLEN